MHPYDAYNLHTNEKGVSPRILTFTFKLNSRLSFALLKDSNNSDEGVSPRILTFSSSG